MQDFAKLFKIEGIGQILVMLGQNEDENPACIFRIPDVGDMELTMAVASYCNGDYDAQLRFATAIFAASNIDNVANTIQPLIDGRDEMFPGIEAI